MTASSDAGPVSMVSSIDDSALKGTPRSPGHVTNGVLHKLADFASGVLVFRPMGLYRSFICLVLRFVIMHDVIPIAFFSPQQGLAQVVPFTFLICGIAT